MELADDAGAKEHLGSPDPFNRAQASLMAGLVGISVAITFVHQKGTFVNEIFWGLWLLPFGVLVMRSGFLPRIPGILLIVNGAAWVVSSLVSLLAPAWAPALHNWLLLPECGELWILAWLLVKGVDPRPLPAGVPA